jgi:hypothetical protein
VRSRQTSRLGLLLPRRLNPSFLGIRLALTFLTLCKLLAWALADRGRRDRVGAVWYTAEASPMFSKFR